MAAFWANVEARARFCRDRGWPYMHIVFPPKPLVMTRHLPASLRGRVQSFYRRCYLPAAPAGAAARVIHPFEELRAVAPDLAYLRTDTHMSQPGCAAVARAALARWGIEYDPRDFYEHAEGTAQGDLARMIGLEEREPTVLLVSRKPGARIVSNLDLSKGNTNHIAIQHSPNALTNRRLAVIGDSFFHQSIRYYAPIFRDVLYLRGLGFHAETLERFAPDAVMTGNAERYLAHVAPDASVPDVMAALAHRSDYHPDEAFTAALAAQLDRTGSQDTSALRQELTRLKVQLEEADELLRDKERQAKALRIAKRRQAQRLAELEAALRTLRTSTSWRVTRPLRTLGRVLRRS